MERRGRPLQHERRPHVDRIRSPTRSGSLTSRTSSRQRTAHEMRDLARRWRARVRHVLGAFYGRTKATDRQGSVRRQLRHAGRVLRRLPVRASSYPGLYDTPFCNGAGGHEAPCQNEMVVSPVIDMTKYSTAKNNSQDASIPPGDLPLLGDTCCSLRSTVIFRCRTCHLPVAYAEIDVRLPGPVDRPEDLIFELGTGRVVFYGTAADLSEADRFCGHDPGRPRRHRHVRCWHVRQLRRAHAVAVVRQRPRVRRYKTSGPQWSYRDLDLFQDNFPELEFNIESYVRADAANDINRTTIRSFVRAIRSSSTAPRRSAAASRPTCGGPAGTTCT